MYDMVIRPCVSICTYTDTSLSIIACFLRSVIVNQPHCGPSRERGLRGRAPPGLWAQRNEVGRTHRSSATGKLIDRHFLSWDLLAKSGDIMGIHHNNCGNDDSGNRVSEISELNGGL